MWGKAKWSINIINMSMPQTNTITNHASRISILRVLNVQSTVKQTHTQREVSTNWLTNQTSHLSLFMFKLDPLVIPQWSRHFVDPAFCLDAFLLDGENIFFFFFVKNWFLEKNLESPLIFVLFLKSKQNKK